METVQVYLVSHRMLMPYELQMGWDHTDLRLYQPLLHLGAYDDAGRAVADPFIGCLAFVPPASLRWLLGEVRPTARGR